MFYLYAYKGQFPVRINVGHVYLFSIFSTPFNLNAYHYLDGISQSPVEEVPVPLTNKDFPIGPSISSTETLVIILSN